MSVGKDSRYNYAAIIQVIDASGFLTEKEHLDLRPTLVSVVHPDNQQFSPNDSDNWSRISWRKLGSGKHWWIIADYSQIIDPFSELKPELKTKYLTQLAVNVPTGAGITQFTVNRVKGINRSDVLRLEDLNPAHNVSVDVSVLSTDESTSVVTASPFNAPSGGVPAALSRVSKVYRDQLRLIAPSAHRAFFEALQFGNPLNVLVE